jgi:hypothetical protein
MAERSTVDISQALAGLRAAFDREDADEVKRLLFEVIDQGTVTEAYASGQSQLRTVS